MSLHRTGDISAPKAMMTEPYIALIHVHRFYTHRPNPLPIEDWSWCYIHNVFSQWPIPCPATYKKCRKHLPMPNTCNKLWICFHKKVHFLLAGYILQQTSISKYHVYLFSDALISLLLSIIDIQAALLNSTFIFTFRFRMPEYTNATAVVH